MRWMCILTSMLLAPTLVCAHPVPKSNHDRTIVVRLQKSDKPGHLSVRIEYTLEVDETTVLLEDMLPFKDEVDFARYRGRPLDYYREFMRIYAPIIRDRLVVQVNGKSLQLAGAEREPRLVDKEKKEPLGHLACDFVFRADFAVAADMDTKFLFREMNYVLQEGQIRLSFVDEAELKLQSVQAPDEELKQRPPTELKPGDEEKLRLVRVVFTPGERSFIAPPIKETPQAPEPIEPEQSAPSIFHDSDSLLWLMASDYSFWLKMVLATLFGAAHALTPGHGKTLVAAYLIGQRGTVWHALILGIVTTLTHTGAVLILAAILFFLPDHLRGAFTESVQKGLGLAAGVMVVCLGMWLLLQRMSGRADHVHLGGDHSHSHGHGHSHSHGFDVGAAQATGVRWWGLVVLGVTGGLIPCWDAVLLFLYFTGRGEFPMVFPALICFSAGLAGVLVLIGILVVQVPKFAKSRLGEGRVVHALPLISAVVIVAMGFWLCLKGIQ